MILRIFSRRILSTEGMAKVGADHWWGVPFVSFVVGLILEKDKLVCFVIGAVVPQVRHQ